MMRKARSFFYRLSRGQVIEALYLVYYYSYLTLFDWRHGTHFAVSQAPGEMGSPDSGGTGNFPAHPRLVRKFLHHCNIERHDPVLDVGHGSGIVLYVASEQGLLDLTGIEYGRIPFEISRRNVGNRAHLVHGDALELDLSRFSVILFFSPFRGEMAVRFFERIAEKVSVILTINHDRIIEPLLMTKGFDCTFEYKHFIYKNFNAKIWRRRVSNQ